MLTIKTDIENKNWLIYILDEFKNINIANFDIEVLLLDEFTFNENIIYDEQTDIWQKQLEEKIKNYSWNDYINEEINNFNKKKC